MDGQKSKKKNYQKCFYQKIAFSHAPAGKISHKSDITIPFLDLHGDGVGKTELGAPVSTADGDQVDLSGDETTADSEGNLQPKIKILIKERDFDEKNVKNNEK